MAKRGKGSRPNLKANVIRDTGRPSGNRQSIRGDVPAWENFERMYEGFQAGIILHSEYLKHLQKKEIIDAIPDKPGTLAAIKALHAGLVSLQNSLNGIHSKHVGRTGDCSQADFDLFQTLCMDYDVLRGEYQDKVEPHGVFVMNQLTAAEEAIASSPSAASVGETIKENIIADSEDDAVTEQENVTND